MSGGVQPPFVQVLEHYKDFLEARDQGEQAAGCEQWDADFDLEGLPDIPMADLPPQPSKVSFH